MAFRSVRVLAPLAAAAASWALIGWGCASSPYVGGLGDGAGSSSGFGGSGGSAGHTGATSSNDGGGGSGINFDGGQGGTGLGEDASCAQTGAEAERIPLDMIVLLDRSGSMMGANWDGATAALQSFVLDPSSDGIHVGIGYFPADVEFGQECESDLYEELDVPVGELPDHAQALVTSIQMQDPEGGSTPMYGALKGILFNATAHQDANPTHKVIVVFATDGAPNSCPDDQNEIPVIAQLASSAYNYNGVQTYVIGISGANMVNLNQIAAAGGTSQAYDVTGNINAFSQKMAEIRTSALACEFIIPDPPQGQQLDKNKVAVRYTPGEGSASEIPKADDAGDCGTGPGWYYDDNDDPTKIVLCPNSCSTVQSDSEAKLDVLFGCEPDLN